MRALRLYPLTLATPIAKKDPLNGWIFNGEPDQC
jgi:hypothetical protein